MQQHPLFFVLLTDGFTNISWYYTSNITLSLYQS